MVVPLRVSQLPQCIAVHKQQGLEPCTRSATSERMQAVCKRYGLQVRACCLQLAARPCVGRWLGNRAHLDTLPKQHASSSALSLLPQLTAGRSLVAHGTAGRRLPGVVCALPHAANSWHHVAHR